MEPESKDHPELARTFRATVQYDGTGYYGFQRQRRGVPSIQAELEQALTRLVGHPARVLGAGRTDTGVHALGQVIGFTIEWPVRHELGALQRALNANLPPDIAITELAETSPEFHPRYDARRRWYEYRVLNTAVRQPLQRQRAWHVAQPLSEDRMNATAALLIGVHDFATFGRVTTGESTVREVFSAAWQRDGEVLLFRIGANAFLNRMVRSIVGSLKMVGSGRWTNDDFAAAMDARDRKRSAAAAPAHGLYLITVEYNDD